MKRYHEEQHIIDRHHRMAQRYGKTRSRGFYRKKDGLDCGNARCLVCHSDKAFGHTPTRQELIAALREREEA